MTPQEHADRVSSAAARGIAEKYKTGRSEHGGLLWRKPGLINEAKKEALDLWTYLHTAEEQQETAKALLAQAIAGQDWGLVTQAFNQLALGNPEGQLTHGD